MKYLSFLIILFSINSFAITCSNDDIDLNPGDVISADMVKDIFDRISGVSSGMTPAELDGTWMCEAQATVVGSKNGYVPNSDGIGASMIQEINFSKQSDDSFIVNFQNHFDSSLTYSEGPPVCRGKLYNGALFSTVHHDGNTCTTRGIFSMRKISKSCFVWMVDSNQGAVTCQKKSLAPLAPKDLVATLSGSSVSLSWTAGDSSTVSYTVKVKTSATGTYSDVVTNNSGTTYTDTLSSGTKWYRIFAVDSNGTSIGSNVVSVTR